MDGSLMKKRRKNNNIYDKSITMDNLYKMWFIIRKTCKNKKEIYYFSLNLNTNLNNIYIALKNKTYKPSKYKTFMIFEPKPRLVMSQTIVDKIVNHFAANYYLIPCLESSLIDTNVATRKGKGSSYSMNLLKKYFNKILINFPNQEIYCLKIDISKYFYSISHKNLLEMLNKKIADRDVIHLIYLIISETNNDYINDSIKYYNKKYHTDIPYYVKNTGLSIGAMSSQFLAIFYLSELDHYIKEKLQCKYYIRYMDDFLILDTDKEKLKRYFQYIKEKIEKLDLRVNKKSNIYRSSKGFSFLGYTYKVIHNKLYISCKKDTYIRIKKKLVYLKSNDIVQYRKSLGSYYGYFELATKVVRENLKMNSREIYYSLKQKYGNCIVIIKEKSSYKTFMEDAKIIWYIFGYKYFDQSVKFGNNSFDKVVNKLKDLNINFVIVSKVEELLFYHKNFSSYLDYYQLSQQFYSMAQKEKKLISRLKIVFHNNSNCYDEVYDFLDEMDKRKISY